MAGLRLRVGGGDKVALKSDQPRDVPWPSFCPFVSLSSLLLGGFARAAGRRNCGSRLSFLALVSSLPRSYNAPSSLTVPVAIGAPSAPPCPGHELTPNGASGWVAARGKPGRPELKARRFHTPVESAIYLGGTSATRPCQRGGPRSGPGPTAGPGPRDPRLDGGASAHLRRRLPLPESLEVETQLRPPGGWDITMAGPGAATGPWKAVPGGALDSASGQSQWQ